MEPDPDYFFAASRAAEVLPAATVRQGGFEDLTESNAFDLIAAVNGPYSYLLDAEQRLQALQRCYQALRPGGVLFLDLANFWWVLRNYRDPPTLTMEIDGTSVTRSAIHTLDFHRGVLSHEDTFTWQMPDGTPCSATKTHRMAMIGFPEMDMFLNEAQFGAVCTYNAFSDRVPAPITGKRIMVTAQKGVDGQRGDG
jgi:SAM-dependent methyltransferase